MCCEEFNWWLAAAVFGFFGLGFLIKEIAAYRLPASHRLNRWLNPPYESRGRRSDGGGISGSGDGWCGGGDGD